VRNSAIALRAQAAGICVHAVGDGARRIGAALRVRRLLRRARFELVYANEAHALTAAWLARSHRRLPLVAMRRVVFPLSHSPISLARYRAAARILAISQAVRSQLLAAGLESTRIEVVSDGVEIPEPISAETRDAARKRWGLCDDETVLVCVGALTAEKGHALLIDAFAKLRGEIANCRLLLAGEGRLRAELERKARDAGMGSSIILAGFVSDIDSVYAAADLFVFPSLYEGAGSSLLRAMAFALPVVALARGGIAEIIEHGRNGVLVAEPKSDALARVAARILRNGELRTKISRAARESVASRFSADRMVDATARIFEELMSGNG
jgi:glycosyltransferase involved in cell wall biosynthesis